MKKLINWLKDRFVPHEGNEHEPHLLRAKGVAVVLLTLLVFEAMFFLANFVILPSFRFQANVLPAVLVDLTNNERQRAGLETLSLNPVLQMAAQMKANDMAEKEYFAHISPEGKTPWHWFDLAGYDFSKAGENLAINFLDSSELTEAWMRSAKHRENIENAGFTDIGIATASGVYKGKKTTFVVQMFGTPRASRIAQTLPVNEEIFSDNQEEFNGTMILGESSTISNGKEENREVYSSFFARIFSSPARSAGIPLLGLALVALIALVLKVFVKVHIQSPRLILNGVLVLVAVFSALVLNHHVLLFAAEII